MQINIGSNYRAVILKLKEAFASQEYTIPQRLHLELPFSNVGLIMPAWTSKYYGIKQIIACPENPGKGLPTIQGKYDLFDICDGRHLAELDAAKLTAIRTAATSVLASSFFVDKPKKLVILGGGVIGQHLREAYNQYYDLEKTVLWSRSKSHEMDLKHEIADADIISCATHAYEPILKGKWIKGKPHIDLVGSYKPQMREADDDLISNADIFIDDAPALTESGDLAIPLSKGIIKMQDIKGNLFDLCSGQLVAEKATRMTLFKSVGHAIEDLASAIYFYESKKN